MHNHRELQVFQLADAIALEICQTVTRFPQSQRYCLTDQIQRAAISVPSNIVEGCSRDTTADYRRFLVIAFGSAMELHYQLTLAQRLELAPDLTPLVERADKLCRMLNRMLHRTGETRAREMPNDADPSTKLS